jgi:hypothetical protein
MFHLDEQWTCPFRWRGPQIRDSVARDSPTTGAMLRNCRAGTPALEHLFPRSFDILHSGADQYASQRAD